MGVLWNPDVTNADFQMLSQRVVLDNSWTRGGCVFDLAAAVAVVALHSSRNGGSFLRMKMSMSCIWYECPGFVDFSHGYWIAEVLDIAAAATSGTKAFPYVYFGYLTSSSFSYYHRVSVGKHHRVHHRLS